MNIQKNEKNEGSFYELYQKYKKLYEEQLSLNKQLQRQLSIFMKEETFVYKKRTRKKKKEFDYNLYQNMKDKGYIDLDIAEKMGVSMRTLYRYLEDRRDKPILNTNDFSYDIYCEGKEQNVPDYKIAREMGISPSTLSRRLKANKKERS